MAAREWVLAWPAGSALRRACGAGVAGRTTVSVRCVSLPPPPPQPCVLTNPHDHDSFASPRPRLLLPRRQELLPRPLGPPSWPPLRPPWPDPSPTPLPSIDLNLPQDFNCKGIGWDSRRRSVQRRRSGWRGARHGWRSLDWRSQRPEGSALVPIRAMLFNRNELEQNLVSLVGASRLELLHQDIRGRLAEFSSNQEKESSIANTSEAGCTDKAVLEAHVARWRSLFGHMDKALQEEGKQLENRFKQVQEMQLNCDKGLKISSFFALVIFTSKLGAREGGRITDGVVAACTFSDAGEPGGCVSSDEGAC